MLSEKQTRNQFDTNMATDRTSRRANLAYLEVTGLKVDIETAIPNLGLWDLEKKKEQFLTIDRF